MECSKKNSCKLNDAACYKKFKKERNLELNHKYFCQYVGGKCKLKDCAKYEVCNKAAKLNYEAWIKAYKADKRVVLQKLAEGGMINGD